MLLRMACACTPFCWARRLVRLKGVVHAALQHARGVMDEGIQTGFQHVVPGHNSMSIYLSLCLPVYLPIYLPIIIYIYIHIHMHTHVRKVSICIYIYTIYVCVHTYACTYKHTYRQTYAHMHIHTVAHIHMYKHTLGLIQGLAPLRTFHYLQHPCAQK